MIGRRYIATAFVFLALGGVLSLLMRLQLAQPEARFIGPGSLQPDFHHARLEHDVPVRRACHAGDGRLSRAVDGGDTQHRLPAPQCIFLLDLSSPAACCCGLPSSSIPARTSAGSPTCRLSGPQYGVGKRADIWAQMITFTEVSALAIAVEIVVTVFKQRAPGMSLDRIPLFVWSMLVTSFLDHSGHAGDHGRKHQPHPRSPCRHAFFQPCRRRRRVAVAASVLVLRPSRGLHHLPAGGGHGVDNCRDVHASARVWLPGDGHGLGGDGGPRLRALGPPYVRCRPATAGRKLFYRLQHGDRGPGGACRFSAGLPRSGRESRSSRRRSCSSSASW